MVKQKQQTCLCGSIMDFPDGEVKATCKCSRVWELDNGGIWFTNLRFPFSQEPASVSEQIVPFLVKKKYERPRNKRKRRAGRC